MKPLFSTTISHRPIVSFVGPTSDLTNKDDVDVEPRILVFMGLLRW